MTQASRRWQEVVKEGWVKAGCRRATRGCREPIMFHMGEPPCPWSQLTTTFKDRRIPFFFTSSEYKK
jgi:hypothetical protein